MEGGGRGEGVGACVRTTEQSVALRFLDLLFKLMGAPPPPPSPPTFPLAEGKSVMAHHAINKTFGMVCGNQDVWHDL